MKHGLLHGVRVYLSGPMDFVASRAEEKASGWRVRVKEFLKSFGAVVFDPWEKPGVRGFHEYGREDVHTVSARDEWTFTPTPRGAKARAKIAAQFWETMHIDLRMVDVSDVVIAYCPTNIYSVGTPHEIVVARQQHKPVLVVSPSVRISALKNLEAHLARCGDAKGKRLLSELARAVPIKPNPGAVPSLWYMPLVGAENFFDGFGFGRYRRRFGWMASPQDAHEMQSPPDRPLLPFLADVDAKLPQRWSLSKNKFVQNDDWLLLDIEYRHSESDQ
ncbi:MAG TPA: hypothetical protein VNA25_22330 [Phycisphaerae bacterium]|nr:hypothetical protein [Phycisphaerae bacterium]